MSTVAAILIAFAVVVLLLVIGGYVSARRRQRLHAGDYDRHLAEADRHLELARASDRGWDRAVMEEAARRALAQHRPGFSPERLDLVLVDDQPGVAEDRAHFVAAGDGEQVRLVLTRGQGGHWSAAPDD